MNANSKLTISVIENTLVLIGTTTLTRVSGVVFTVSTIAPFVNNLLALEHRGIIKSSTPLSEVVLWLRTFGVHETASEQEIQAAMAQADFEANVGSIVEQAIEDLLKKEPELVVADEVLTEKEYDQSLASGLKRFNAIMAGEK